MANNVRMRCSTDPDRDCLIHQSRLSRRRRLCDTPEARAWPENVRAVVDFIQQHRDHHDHDHGHKVEVESEFEVEVEGDINKGFVVPNFETETETEFCAQITFPLEPSDYELLIELLQLTGEGEALQLEEVDVNVDTLETTGKSRNSTFFSSSPFLSISRARRDFCPCPFPLLQSSDEIAYFANLSIFALPAVSSPTTTTTTIAPTGDGDGDKSKCNKRDVVLSDATSCALIRQELASLGRHLHQRMRPLFYNPRLCAMTITRQPETVFHLCFKHSVGRLIEERAQQACSS
ncbi:hypothetical protein UCRPA7_3161 [Phaeoacremonium minimum UCRPA7]|uniref:Uncharacterized protein n=1 Tax=Phaeoacremonium minimum (strain UCR-PA7) TaxID=1286976 RepID=R8BPW1_PHAM7|nr:hypothetical protein UCRPA7_3161 [Phaeoacremonium minimum UCRPA7]EOO01335.1 hypothetical protein UCRPA7_3161 [Phaeoacremonium minimum UCRPA7]